MSIKIYDGVRFPLAKLGEFVEWVQSRGLKRVLKNARKLMDGVDMESDPVREFFEKYPEATEWMARVNVVMGLIGRAADTPLRNPFDLESGWRVWIPPGKKFVLAKPYGEAPNHVKLPSWVESYGYWDNVDPDEDVSDREWRQREKDWEIAFNYEPHCKQMLIEIFKVERHTEARGMYHAWVEYELLQMDPKRKKPKRKRAATS
jgi:hypothetical protein